MESLSAERIKRGIRSPNLFFREANRLYHRRCYTRAYNTRGVSIMDEEWDNLILLDACRYDLFEQTASLSGDLESRVSRGSNTVEFLEGNFTEKVLHDTVYVTANPQLYRHREQIDVEFHDVLNVWQDNDWNEDKQTVLPATMADRVLTTYEKYPNKRILAHFIQPHYPFLTDVEVFDDFKAFLSPDEAGSWYEVMTGALEISANQVWKAYRDTLQRVLPEVSRLLDALPGQSVVTSDHGNMIGERASPLPIREWGHPAGIYTPELVTVPWFVSASDKRRTTRSEPPVAQEKIEDTVVSERLENLGYT